MQMNKTERLDESFKRRIETVKCQARYNFEIV